jgi:uncharacterized protein YecT (DUF1311 family)
LINPIVALFALQSLSAYPADTPCDSYKDGSTTAMVECLGIQSDRWDERLNGEYRATIRRAEVDAGKLRASQRAWLRFRDQNCGTYATVKGTISRILSAKCWRDMTRDRAIELREMSWKG